MILEENKKFLHLIGSTKSGTTLLTQCVDLFNETSISKTDDGIIAETQFHQTVIPSVSTEHHTEKSNLNTMENKIKLFSELKKLWDLDKPILVQKNPHFISKTRLLQSLFPNSYFIMIIRNGIAKSMGEALYNYNDIYKRCNAWVQDQTIFMNDKDKLNHVLIIKYEDLVSNTQDILDKIADFLDIKKIIFSKDTVFKIVNFNNNRNIENKICNMNDKYLNLFYTLDKNKQQQCLMIMDKVLKQFKYI